MAGSTRLNRALDRGDRSYDSFLGEWWRRKSHDRSHRRAYLRMADQVREVCGSGKKAPKVIVDYACGAAGALAVLARRFPEAQIVGIDGSDRMLELARYDLQRSQMDADIVPARSMFSGRGPRIRLVKTALPEFSLPSGRADAVLFVFPNMNFSAGHAARLKKHIFGNRQQCDVARFLSRLPDVGRTHDTTRPEDIYEDLLYERAISRNIHQLLKPGGWWFKVDYSNCLRYDLRGLDQWRMLFSESAFDLHIEERPHRDPFELAQCVYHRSKVIRDVYQQTHKESDRTGGYMISMFRAR